LAIDAEKLPTYIEAKQYTTFQLYNLLGVTDDGSKDAGDYRKEGTEEKEEGTDLFYKRPESFLSAITASFTAFSTVSFTNSNSNPPP
jgi:hypothetical protein